MGFLYQPWKFFWPGLEESPRNLFRITCIVEPIDLYYCPFGAFPQLIAPPPNFRPIDVWKACWYWGRRWGVAELLSLGLRMTLTTGEGGRVESTGVAFKGVTVAPANAWVGSLESRTSNPMNWKPYVPFLMTTCLWGWTIISLNWMTLGLWLEFSKFIVLLPSFLCLHAFLFEQKQPNWRKITITSSEWLLFRLPGTYPKVSPRSLVSRI